MSKNRSDRSFNKNKIVLVLYWILITWEIVSELRMEWLIRLAIVNILAKLDFVSRLWLMDQFLPGISLFPLVSLVNITPWNWITLCILGVAIVKIDQQILKLCSVNNFLHFDLQNLFLMYRSNRCFVILMVGNSIIYRFLKRVIYVNLEAFLWRWWNFLTFI